MFGLNIRFQIAALFLLIIIMIDFYKNNKLKVLSSRFFEILLFTTLINLIFDMITVYTITHLNTVPAYVNRLFHQCFIASVIAVLFMNYMYIFILENEQKRVNFRHWCVLVIPLFISAGFIIFAPLEYKVNSHEAYSYGVMVYSVYACGFVYNVTALKSTFNKDVKLSNEQRVSIRLGLFVWLFFLLIQAVYHRYLLSGFGFTLMLLCNYFSFENPKENYDIETECFNRTAFHKMMSECYENGKTLFLINIAIENYSRVNSLLGHDKGIEALRYIKEIADRYFDNEIFHSRSNVFTIFMTEDIEEWKDKLDHLEYSIQHNEFSDMQLKCHISIMDIHKYTKSKNEVYDLIDFMSDIFVNDDKVMYYLNEALINKKIRHDKIDKLVSEVLENDGFEMFYQPIYWPKEKKFKSAEALIRLKKNSELGYISPEEFIPIAEEKGMIMEIGDKVLEMVVKFIADNSIIKSQMDYIEVNLSGIQAVYPDIDKRLKEITQKYRIAPNFINLEITETATIDSDDILKINMKKLKDIGFSFSMDDFGTGYSNLSQMSELEYDLVKIDKSLIWPVFYEKSEKSQKLLDSVIKMLIKIDVKIVAEGVETKEMADYLADNGVEHLQGYYYSKPIPGSELINVIENEL